MKFLAALLAAVTVASDTDGEFDSFGHLQGFGAFEPSIGNAPQRGDVKKPRRREMKDDPEPHVPNPHTSWHDWREHHPDLYDYDPYKECVFP